MNETENGRKIKSVKRIQRFIELLRKNNGATLTEVAGHFEITIGTVHTYLNTLQDMNYIEKEDGVYKLSPKHLVMGEHVRNQTPLYRAAQPDIDKLADSTGEAIHLIIEFNGKGISLYERLGENAIGTDYHRKLRQRSHTHLHCTASGKAILEKLTKRRVNEILDNHGLTQLTPNTITERSALFENLKRIRSRGYAVNDEEEVLGIFAVGVPIVNEDGDALGSLSISAPKSHMEQTEIRDELINKMNRAKNAIEANLHSESFQ